jgi:hypothetical protein
MRNGVDVFQQDRELVAAQTGHGIGRADAGPEPFRDQTQQLVTCGVPEAVVDILEPVEVDEQHRQHPSTPLRAGQSMTDTVLEQSPVR